VYAFTKATYHFNKKLLWVSYNKSQAIWLKDILMPKKAACVFKCKRLFWFYAEILYGRLFKYSP